MAITPMDYRIPAALEGTILGRIACVKRAEVAGASRAWPAESIRMALDRAPEVRSLKRALLRRHPGIIAEIKKASPSAGIIRAEVDPVDIGRQYQESGAAAISVLTEVQHFQGTLESLARLRFSCGIPLLRKDFIIDSYQLFEARHAGADAVLLIAALHDLDGLMRLRSECERLGMEALVEVHDERELEMALAAGSKFVGVNNRSLTSFDVSLDTGLRLGLSIPGDVVAVAESGLRTADDIRRLTDVGYRGFLIGETLMRAASPGKALGELLSSLGKGRRAAS